MTHDSAQPTRSLLRRYLAAGYAFFIAYASLSPFTGWQEQGLAFPEVLLSPLALTYTTFDAALNLLAYLPFGMLIALTLRVHLDAKWSVLGAIVCGLLFSAGLEYLQMYLPGRTSSNADILSNSLGMLLGAVVAVRVARHNWFARITAWRIDLFRRAPGVDFGLALMMLWVFAQMNPTLPMLGSVFIAVPFYGSIVEIPQEPFNLWESLAISLNLMMAGMLLLVLLHNRRHAVAGLVLVLGVVALAKFAAAAALLKSWALLLWLNNEAMSGIALGLLLLAITGWLPRAWLHRVLAATVIAYLALVYLVLDDSAASSATRLYHWRYGHLRNFNRLSQTVSSLFPLLLGGYLWWVMAHQHKEEKEG